MATVWIQPKNGKYLVRWYIDDPKQEKSETYAKLGNTKTPGTAKHRQHDLEQQFVKGTYIDPKLQKQKLGVVVDKWATRAETSGTEFTRQALRADLGDLADMPISDLRAPHVRDWVDQLRKGRPWMDGKPLAPGTVLRRLGMLKTVLNQLVADELLTRNPAAGVKLPPLDAEVLPETLLTLQDALTILDVVRDRRLRGMCLVALKAGLRPGEVAGLRVRDVDQAGQTLSVMQQTTTQRTTTSVLKTKASRRSVPVPESLLVEIKPFMEGRGLSDLLFTTTSNKPYSSKDLADWLHRRQERTDDLQRFYSWRDFRHFYASCLIHQGRNVKTVQQAMGHARSSVTLDTYTHLWPNEDSAIRASIDTVWM